MFRNYNVKSWRRLRKDLQMTLKNEDFSDTLKNDGILRSFDGLFKKMAFRKGIIKISDIKIINE